MLVTLRKKFEMRYDVFRERTVSDYRCSHQHRLRATIRHQARAAIDLSFVARDDYMIRPPQYRVPGQQPADEHARGVRD